MSAPSTSPRPPMPPTPPLSSMASMSAMPPLPPMPQLPPPPMDRVRLSPALVDRVRTRLATPPVRIDTQAILAALRAEGCMLDGRDLRAAAYQVRSELTG